MRIYYFIIHGEAERREMGTKSHNTPLPLSVSSQSFAIPPLLNKFTYIFDKFCRICFLLNYVELMLTKMSAKEAREYVDYSRCLISNEFFNHLH